MNATVVFSLLAALHAGFQVTVTTMVYPALVEVDRRLWDEAHARHSRRIVPLVVATYAALLLGGAALVADGPGDVAVAGLAVTLGSVVVTGVAAAPIHGRLGPETGTLRRRLVQVDRIRCLLAVAGAVLAAVAVAVD